MFDEIESKTRHKDKMMDRGKGSMTLSEVKPVENISKNLQCFLEISVMQKEVPLQVSTYEACDPTRVSLHTPKTLETC